MAIQLKAQPVQTQRNMPMKTFLHPSDQTIAEKKASLFPQTSHPTSRAHRQTTHKSCTAAASLDTHKAHNAADLGHLSESWSNRSISQRTHSSPSNPGRECNINESLLDGVDRSPTCSSPALSPWGVGLTSAEAHAQIKPGTARDRSTGGDQIDAGGRIGPQL